MPDRFTELLERLTRMATAIREWKPSSDTVEEPVCEICGSQPLSDDHKVCIECGVDYEIEIGHNPTPLCHGCAHAYVREFAEALPQILDRMPSRNELTGLLFYARRLSPVGGIDSIRAMAAASNWLDKQLGTDK